MTYRYYICRVTHLLTYTPLKSQYRASGDVLWRTVLIYPQTRDEIIEAELGKLGRDSAIFRDAVKDLLKTVLSDTDAPDGFPDYTSHLTYPDKARTFEQMGDYFKQCEKNFTLQKFMKGLPIVIRADGRHFSKFCKGLEKPFSQKFLNCMKHTCIELGKEFNPSGIFVQSDEISLFFLNQDVMFDGTVQKYVSNIAAYASVVFNEAVLKYMPEHAAKRPTFDCRAFQLPNVQEAFDNVLWRQIDAMKNSVSLLACQHFSVKQLSGKNTKQRKEMLADIGVDWNIINDGNQQFGRGAFFKRCSMVKPIDFPLSQKQIEQNKSIFKEGDVYMIKRNEWSEVEVPKLSKITHGSYEEKRLIETVFSVDVIE